MRLRLFGIALIIFFFSFFYHGQFKNQNIQCGRVILVSLYFVYMWHASVLNLILRLTMFPLLL